MRRWVYTAGALVGVAAGVVAALATYQPTEAGVAYIQFNLNGSLVPDQATTWQPVFSWAFYE